MFCFSNRKIGFFFLENVESLFPSPLQRSCNQSEDVVAMNSFSNLFNFVLSMVFG